MNDTPLLLPYEEEIIANRVALGFDGEVLPIEAHLGAVLVTDAYDGDDLDEAGALVAYGCRRLAQMHRLEIPF